MKRFISASIVSASLALAGCGGEAEKAPDITEAIPLNPEGPSANSETPGGKNAQGQAAGGSDTPAVPSADPNRQNLPDSMESGANPPGMTEPPAGSKVQRIEG